MTDTKRTLLALAENLASEGGRASRHADATHRLMETAHRDAEQLLTDAGPGLVEYVRLCEEAARQRGMQDALISSAGRVQAIALDAR